MASNVGSETIKGVFEWEKFRSDETNWVVATLTNKTTIVGTAQPGDLVKGIEYEFVGNRKIHPTFGPQFQFISYRAVKPSTRAGVVAYLKRFAKGFGDRRSHQLVDKYGPDGAIDMLKNNPSKVAIEINGISHKVAKLASEALKEIEATQQVKIDLFDLFDDSRLPLARIIDKAIELWGIGASDRLKKDPFLLIEYRFRGIGFPTADQLWKKLGLPLKSMRRQSMAVWYAIESSKTGSVWHTREEIESQLAQLLDGGVCASEAIEHAIEEGMIVKEYGELCCYYGSAKNAADEERVNRETQRICQGTVEWPSLEGSGLSEHQLIEANKALDSKIAILTGGPGTGKTFTTAAIIRAIRQQYPSEPIYAMAPTGKAGVRMNEMFAQYEIGGIRARTIHKSLGPIVSGTGEWSFIHNAGNRFPGRFLIGDEWSMVTAWLDGTLKEACRPDMHMLIVGDPYQLPPVGAGSPLLDMLDSGMRYGELSEVHRFAGRIAVVCKAIQEQQRWEPSKEVDLEAEFPENLRHVERHTSRSILDTLVMVIDRVKARGFNPFEDMQVVVPLNENSPLSRSVVNESLQRILNPNGKPVDGSKFRVGDKIVCRKNSIFSNVDQSGKTYVANGEIGTITDATKSELNLFVSDETVCVPRGSWEDMQLAYAITVHSAQGSQWPVVITIADDSFAAKKMCDGSWWKTAISRSAKLGFTIGSMSTIVEGCSWSNLSRRRTLLASKIRKWMR